MKKILITLLIVLCLTGCTSKRADESITSVADLAGKKVGVISGTVQAVNATTYVPDCEPVEFSSASELIAALNTDKISAYITDEGTIALQMQEVEGIDYFVVPNTSTDTGFIFSDDAKTALNNFNNFLYAAKKVGYIESLEDKWIKNPSSDKKIDIPEYIPANGTLRIICTSDQAPYCFISDGEPQGFCIEVIKRFAYEYGYKLDISYGTFDAILSGVQSRKYDIGVNDITITPERKKSMTFSNPIRSTGITVVFKAEEEKPLTYDSLESLNGVKMGCMSGSIYDVTIKENYEDSEIVYFNSRAELLMGLKQKKVEAYLADEPVAIWFAADNKDIGYIEEPIQTVEYGICFSDEASIIRELFDKYLKECKDNGYLEKLQNKWISANGTKAEVGDYNLTGKNGIVKACTTPDAAPFSFFKNNKFEGFEVELLMSFCEAYGYDLQIESTSFDALISSVSSNKYDVAFNGIYITEERKKSVDFCEPIYVGNVVAVVRRDDVKKENLLLSLKNKIYQTFIEEDRYKLIIDGICTTLSIVACSMICGTIFGFVLFLLTRKLNGSIKKIVDVLAYIISGLPIVVLLMIMFYIIFAKSSLSGSVISIICFTLTEGFAVYGMLKTGVGAIDKGQYEGALALGYTDKQSLFKFVLPQALRIVMPTYRGEIVSLIKSSSVVGYVTVQDITRVSDIIRSRTYDAFFPLIVTAIIYFVLAWLLTKLADHLQRELLSNEKSKDEILKSLGQK